MPDPSRQFARYKPDVSLGNILTIIGMLGALAVWGLRLEGRVDAQASIVALQKENTDLRVTHVEQEQTRQRGDADRALTGIQRSLERIETKLDGKADKK